VDFAKAFEPGRQLLRDELTVEIRGEDWKMFVSTIFAGDTNRYETAIAHPFYNDGTLIVVGSWDDEEDARHGHKYWVERVVLDAMPNPLTDVSTSETALLLDAFDGAWREHPRRVIN
jgi:hypothetical protein